MRLEESSDEVAFEAVGLGEDCEPAVLPVREAAAGADPEGAVAVEKKRADQVIGQAVGRGVGGDFRGCDVVEAVGRSDPYAAIGAGREGEDDLTEEAAADAVVLELSGLPAVQAIAVGPNPHGSVGGLSDCGDYVIRECRNRVEVLLPEDVEAAGFGADPEIAFPVFKAGQDAARIESGLSLRMDAAFFQHEEALIGSDPEVSARV